MDGVGRNVGIAISEVKVYHNQIVNVINVIADLPLRHFACNASYDEVSRCSTSNLVRDVRWYVKLTVRPTEIELGVVSLLYGTSHCCNTYTFSMQIDIIALGVC